MPLAHPSIRSYLLLLLMLASLAPWVFAVKNLQPKLPRLSRLPEAVLKSPGPFLAALCNRYLRGEGRA
jgi:hypothetical protein